MFFRTYGSLTTSLYGLSPGGIHWLVLWVCVSGCARTEEIQFTGFFEVTPLDLDTTPSTDSDDLSDTHRLWVHGLFQRCEHAPVVDEDAVTIPSPGEESAVASVQEVAPARRRSPRSTGPVDPNRATVEELTSLSGIGPALAQRIIEARPFSCPDDLLRVRGIGPATLDRFRSRIHLDE